MWRQKNPFLHANKGRKRETVLDAREISCTLHVEELGPVQYIDFPAPLWGFLEILLKDSSFSVLQEEASSQNSLVEGLATVYESLGKESPFLKVKGVLRTSEGLAIIVSIVPWHKCGSAQC